VPNPLQDTTFELERQRNRPEKYNREVVAKTLNAIKKITKIRVRRQERFYEQRMRNARKVAKVIAKKELEKQVRSPQRCLSFLHASQGHDCSPARLFFHFDNSNFHSSC
jgi:dsDNA-specific endonuclease/ATPase MutS2